MQRFLWSDETKNFVGGIFDGELQDAAITSMRVERGLRA